MENLARFRELTGTAEGVAEGGERVLARARQRDGVTQDRLGLTLRAFHDVNQSEDAIRLFGRRRHRECARHLMTGAIVAAGAEVHFAQAPPPPDRHRGARPPRGRPAPPLPPFPPPPPSRRPPPTRRAA